MFKKISKIPSDKDVIEVFLKEQKIETLQSIAVNKINLELSKNGLERVKGQIAGENLKIQRDKHKILLDKKAKLMGEMATSCLNLNVFGIRLKVINDVQDNFKSETIDEICAVKA